MTRADKYICDRRIEIYGISVTRIEPCKRLIQFKNQNCLFCGIIIVWFLVILVNLHECVQNKIESKGKRLKNK